MKNIFIPNIITVGYSIFKCVIGFFFQLYKTKQKNLGICKGRDLLILGNGPSLKTLLQKYDFSHNDKDIMAVNYFANNSEFFIIKPNQYVLVDPMYFLSQDNFPELFKDKLYALKSSFEKVDWHIDLYIPHRKDPGYVVNAVKANKNITIKYLSYRGDFNDIPWNKVKYYLWSHLMLKFPTYNVLNTAVFIGVNKCYKNVYLCGADSTWHENIKVDQDSNLLYIEYPHFYGETRREPVLLDNGDKSYLSREMLSYYWLFNAYDECEKYSQYRGVKIYNASSYSCIDSFERAKLV